ncbi:hypothetical protein AAFF27_21370 [Xylophilus sp. GW821-FHT01B05]
MANTYRFGVLGYLLIGAVCGLFFIACAVGAFLAQQYPPIAIFAVFILMGLYMVASAGSFEISDKAVTHRNLFGTFRMAWAEVRKVELGTQGAIILHGENKRFALAPPGYWSGRQKTEALALLRKAVERSGAIRYSSYAADFKIHRNVRAPAGQD